MCGGARQVNDELVVSLVGCQCWRSVALARVYSSSGAKSINAASQEEGRGFNSSPICRVCMAFLPVFPTTLKGPAHQAGWLLNVRVDCGPCVRVALR